MCYNPDNPCECLTSGSLCEPCKMTAKDREMEDAHLSNISAGDQTESTSEPELNMSSTEVVKDRGRNWGWMLSGIICLNILILGCALVSGSASSRVKISTLDLQAFLIVLILLTSIWMIYYIIYTTRTANAVTYKDEHAGPIWLRGMRNRYFACIAILGNFLLVLIAVSPSGGLMLFGLLSIIMDIFKIASYVGYLHCDSGVKVAFPVVQLVFVLVQVKTKKSHLAVYSGHKCCKMF